MAATTLAEETDVLVLESADRPGGASRPCGRAITGSTSAPSSPRGPGR
ncbi:hypothetical protein [Streptomyces sp. NRRL S-1868]|nr:hypothetical protein [Streptomyces sp. NRRL S-1868]